MTFELFKYCGRIERKERERFAAVGIRKFPSLKTDFHSTFYLHFKNFVIILGRTLVNAESSAET